MPRLLNIRIRLTKNSIKKTEENIKFWKGKLKGKVGITTPFGVTTFGLSGGEKKKLFKRALKNEENKLKQLNKKLNRFTKALTFIRKLI